MVNVNELIKKHEDFKAKGFKLSLPEIYDWLALQDDMATAVQQLKAESIEKGADLDKVKNLRLLELKNSTDANGKSYTEKTIDAMIKDETYDEKVKLDTDKTVIELLQKKADNITQLTQLLKLNYKTDFTL